MRIKAITSTSINLTLKYIYNVIAKMADHRNYHLPPSLRPPTSFYAFHPLYAQLLFFAYYSVFPYILPKFWSFFNILCKKLHITHLFIILFLTPSFSFPVIRVTLFAVILVKFWSVINSPNLVFLPYMDMLLCCYMIS